MEADFVLSKAQGHIDFSGGRAGDLKAVSYRL
jgi:hypothetical protein